MFNQANWRLNCKNKRKRFKLNQYMWKFCRNMNTHYFGFMMKCMRLEMNCTLNNRCSSVACLKFRWYSFILKLWKSKSVEINFHIFDTYLFIYDKQKYRYDKSFNPTAPKIVILSDFEKVRDSRHIPFWKRMHDLQYYRRNPKK